MSGTEHGEDSRAQATNPTMECSYCGTKHPTIAFATDHECLPWYRAKLTAAWKACDTERQAAERCAGERDAERANAVTIARLHEQACRENRSQLAELERISAALGTNEGHSSVDHILTLRKDLASALESLRGMRGLLKEALSCVPSNDNPDSCDYIDELRDRITSAITATSGGAPQT
jgi:hypothetical protein